MTTFLVIVILIACFVLSFFILVQKPKGGGLSGAFGSVGAQVMGVKQSGDVMEKGTWVTMILIAVLSIASTFTLDVPNRLPAQPTQQEQPAQQAPAQQQPAPAPGN